MNDLDRLNVFQRTIRLWETIHPYNAVQVMRLRGVLEEAAVREAWSAVGRDALPTSGIISLTEPVLEDASLDDAISRRLNAKFSDGDPSLVPFHLADDGRSHCVGLAYRHIVADSFSIRAILQRWLVHRYGGEALPPMRVARGGYWRHLGPAALGWSPLRTAADIFRWTSLMKRVRRVENDDFADGTTRFAHATLPAVALPRVKEAARRHHATVNDVFLSAIASVCGKLEINSPRLRRVDLALGTIHDLRGVADGLRGTHFGLFLGFTDTLIRATHMSDPAARLAAIAAQSRVAKKRHAAAASQFRFAVNLVAGALLGWDRGKLVEFYRKRFPLAGGISNVNLNATPLAPWIARELIDYLRVSPTGPIMPLVFTPTTVGESINVGLTVRAKLIDEATQKNLLAQFASELHRVV